MDNDDLSWRLLLVIALCNSFGTMKDTIMVGHIWQSRADLAECFGGAK